MKRLIRILLFAIIIILFHPFPTFASTVRVETLHSQDKYPTEGTYPVLFRLKISKPWYIHGTKSEGEGLIPTLLSFQEFPGLKIIETKFPVPQKKKFPYTSKPIEIYSGSLLVRATLAVSGASPLGNQVIKGNLSYQACSSTLCLPPENVSVHLSTIIVPRGTPTKALNQEIFLSAYREMPDKGIPGIRSGAGPSHRGGRFLRSHRFDHGFPLAKGGGGEGQQSGRIGFASRGRESQAPGNHPALLRRAAGDFAFLII